MLLENGGNPNHADNIGNTPLLVLVRGDETQDGLDCLELLLAAGAISSKLNIDDLNAVMCAGVRGRVNYFLRLLKAGSNVNQRNKKGNTVLHLLCRIQEVPHRKDVIDLALKFGADLGMKNNDGLTPSESAIKSGNKDLLELLRPPVPVEPLNDSVNPENAPAAPPKTKD